MLTVWGRTLAGRGLIVAVYHSSGHIWKIIGAREMRTDEWAEFAKLGGEAMNDKRELPQTPDDVGEFMDNLVFEELPTAQDEADTLASLPAGSDVMIVRSVRLPLELDQAVADAAKAVEMPKSTWVRQAIEMALAAQAGQDEPISRADALRALTLLRPIRHVA